MATGAPGAPDDDVARVLQAYDAEGFHRTGHLADDENADWLAREAAALGATLAPALVELSRAGVIGGAEHPALHQEAEVGAPAPRSRGAPRLRAVCDADHPSGEGA